MLLKMSTPTMALLLVLSSLLGLPSLHAQTCQGTEVMDHDWGVKGSEYRYFSTSSRTSCRCTCMNEAQCIGWVFYQGWCYLKDNFKNPKGTFSYAMSDNTGMWSGVKPLPLRAQHTQSAATKVFPGPLQGVDMYAMGKEYATAPATSALWCGVACRIDGAKCIGYVFYNNWCYLKGAAAATNPVFRGMAGAVSGYKPTRMI